MIDLHIHSTFSDGTDTPEEIVRKANDIGLKAIALTDHDIIDGLIPFNKEAKKYPNLIAINGCELAVSHDYANVEIIALDIKDLKAFRKRQEMIENIRHEGNMERIEMLIKHGIEISLEELSVDENGEKRRLIGRPHFAQLMVRKGYVKSINEAFGKYLGKTGKAFVERKNPSAKETIEFINNTGAISVLAHPVFTGVEGNNLVKLVREFKDFGLQAIECYHSEQSKIQSDFYLKIADSLGLMVSGGSDYHGLVKPDISLGYGKGDLNVPDTILSQFSERNNNTLDLKRNAGYNER